MLSLTERLKYAVEGIGMKIAVNNPITSNSQQKEEFEFRFVDSNQDQVHNNYEEGTRIERVEREVGTVRKPSKSKVEKEDEMKSDDIKKTEEKSSPMKDICKDIPMDETIEKLNSAAKSASTKKSKPQDAESDFISSIYPKGHRLNPIDVQYHLIHSSNESVQSADTVESKGIDKTPVDKDEDFPGEPPEGAVISNMAAIPFIEDESQHPNTMNLGSGVVINIDAMNEPEKQPEVVQPQISIPQPITENSYLDYLEGKDQAGFGRHKVDAKQKPKAATVKANPDDVRMDSSIIHVDMNPPKPDKVWPEAFSTPLVQPDPSTIVEEDKPPFDNSCFVDKYGPFIKDIEIAARKQNMYLTFTERLTFDGTPNGLLIVTPYHYDGKVYTPAPLKAFTIDNGVIIDGRKKMFPGVVSYGYEDMQAYPIFIKNNFNGKNTFNEKLFNDFFLGGVGMLEEKDGMYTPNYRELNKYVALITIPSKEMNRNARKAVVGRLQNAMDAGVFAKALEIDPGARFRFETYDKETRAFTLINDGVPYRFGTNVLSTKSIKITFGSDGKTTLN